MVRALWDGRSQHGAELIRAAAALLSALALTASCAPQTPQAAISARACHRLALTVGGKPVVGVEDLAYEPLSRTLYLSAYDRLAVEHAKGEPPGGGLYALDYEALAGNEAAVKDLLAPVLGAPARPHGLDVRTLGPGRVRIAVVNRAFLANERGGWTRRPEINVLDRGPDGVQLAARVLGAALCRANDLTFHDGETLLVSFDRGVCLADGREPVGGPALGLVGMDGSISRQDSPLRFPNGVARTAGAVWVAGTLDAQIGPADGKWRVALPGAPDNLTLDPRGRLIAAVHPQLWRFGLFRFGWPGFSRAPSRIVRYDPLRNSLRTLYDDPGGKVFSGATGAAAAEDLLVIGGVREHGVLVCPLTREA